MQARGDGATVSPDFVWVHPMTFPIADTLGLDMLRTDRLLLWPVAPDDAPAIAGLAGEEAGAGE